MVSWLKNAAAGIAALAFLTGTAAAQVPDPYARELARHLTRIDETIDPQGYQRAAGPFAGGLVEGRMRRQAVTLRAGQDYRVIGVCERRCRNLNLRLLDPNGAIVVQDVADNAVPVLHVRPTATGQYQIEVMMAQCSAQPCWYAFNIYSR